MAGPRYRLATPRLQLHARSLSKNQSQVQTEQPTVGDLEIAGQAAGVSLRRGLAPLAVRFFANPENCFAAEFGMTSALTGATAWQTCSFVREETLVTVGSPQVLRYSVDGRPSGTVQLVARCSALC